MVAWIPSRGMIVWTLVIMALLLALHLGLTVALPILQTLAVVTTAAFAVSHRQWP